MDLSQNPQDASSCMFQPKQCEQMFEKMSLIDRKLLAECDQSNVDGLWMPVSGAGKGQPERWFCRHADTGRYTKFVWPSIRFSAIPAASNVPELISHAAAVIQPVMLPLSLLSNRYEIQNTVQVLSIDVPFKLLELYVATQVALNDLELPDDELSISEQEVESMTPAEAMYASSNKNSIAVRSSLIQLDVAWKQAMGLDDTGRPKFLRECNTLVFRWRGDLDVPFFGLASSREPGKVICCCCWEDATILQGFCSQSLPTTLHGPITFLPYLNRIHAPHIEVPRWICQNNTCQKWMPKGERSALGRLFRRHKGPTAQKREQFDKDCGRRLVKEHPEWEDEQVEEEIERCWSESPDAVAVLSGLKGCSQCSVAKYCSKTCQQSDWPTHKLYCKQTNSNAKATTN
jgi:hypothetical protein